MEQHDADRYATNATDQVGAAVARGDADAANAVVDRVASDGHTGFATVLNTALAHTSLADEIPDLTTAEQYALWLVYSGIADSVSEDMNEGGDPITGHGGVVTDEDAATGWALAADVMDWINDNGPALLALVRGQATVVTAPR